MLDQFQLRPGPLELSLNDIAMMAYETVKADLTVEKYNNDVKLPHSLYLWKAFIKDARHVPFASVNDFFDETPLLMTPDQKAHMVERIIKYNEYSVDKFIPYANKIQLDI